MSASDTEYRVMINETQRRQIDLFWQNFGSITLVQWIAGLLAHFRDVQLREDSEIFLKISLCLIFGTEKEIFTKEDFIYLVQNFGPFDNGFLQRIFDLVEKPYFIGKIDKLEVENILQQSPLCTHFVRMSNNSNEFTLSYVFNNLPQTILNKRFGRDPNSGKIIVKSFGKNEEYDTIDDYLLATNLLIAGQPVIYPIYRKKIAIMIHFYEEVANDSNYHLHSVNYRVVQALVLIKLGELYIKIGKYPIAMRYFLLNEIKFHAEDGRNCLIFLYKDQPTCQLFEKSIHQNIIFEEHIKYMPGSSGADAARQHFYLLNDHNNDHNDNSTENIFI